MDIGYFVTDMVLPARWVFLKKCSNRSIAGQRFDEFNLRAIERAICTGRIHEADLHALIGQIERRMYFRRTHDVAVKNNAVRDGRRCDPDMV